MPKQSSQRKSPRRATTSRKSRSLASKKVERALHERKARTLRAGRSGQKVTSRKQAIAIGLSEARKSGPRFPRPKPAAKR